MRSIIRIKIFVFVVFSVLITLAMVISCTDSERARIAALGKHARIMCYSGGQLIFDEYSTGKVMHQASGYFFVSANDNRLKEVNGDCVVDYNAPARAKD